MSDFPRFTSALPVRARRASKQDHAGNRSEKRNDRRRTAANPAVVIEGHTIDHPTRASIRRGDDANDWTLVHHHDARTPTSVPTTSDTASTQGVGPELNAVNMQLHDELNKSASCFSGDRTACHRRCRQCLEGNDDEHRGMPQYEQYNHYTAMGDDDGALQNWAPVPYNNDASYKYMGCWMDNAVGAGAYNANMYTEVPLDV
ncbi:Ammonium transporter [Purpureocillium lavendulum]|uniref:Ammonium transporter n=1 Tax=Purpureocillium lavendulum TaxID=1247861 RepID=A0AB34G643_9HYPO|nr:Ammonium transporter [Purpureocillium lavendulum]